MDSYKDSLSSYRLELLFHCYIPFWITSFKTFIVAPRSTPSLSWLQCSNLGDAYDRWYEYIDLLVQLRHSVVYANSYSCLHCYLPFLFFTWTLWLSFTFLYLSTANILVVRNSPNSAKHGRNHHATYVVYIKTDSSILNSTFAKINGWCLISLFTFIGITCI